MFATATAHKQPLIGARQGLRAFRFRLTFSRGQAQVVDGQEADLVDMSRHAFDVLDLLSGEGCVTDLGLVERAARLRVGWA